MRNDSPRTEYAANLALAAGSQPNPFNATGDRARDALRAYKARKAARAERLNARPAFSLRGFVASLFN